MNSLSAIASQVNIDARVRNAVRWLADADFQDPANSLVVFVLWAINSLVDLVVSFIPSSQAPQSIRLLSILRPQPQASHAAPRQSMCPVFWGPTCLGC